MVPSGIVLGHVISKKGIEVDKAKVEIIINLPTPKNVTNIKSFLGHFGSYKRFIQNFNKIDKALFKLLAKDKELV